MDNFLNEYGTYTTRHNGKFLWWLSWPNSKPFLIGNYCEITGNIAGNLMRKSILRVGKPVSIHWMNRIALWKSAITTVIRLSITRRNNCGLDLESSIIRTSVSCVIMIKRDSPHSYRMLSLHFCRFHVFSDSFITFLTFSLPSWRFIILLTFPVFRTPVNWLPLRTDALFIALPPLFSLWSLFCFILWTVFSVYRWIHKFLVRPWRILENSYNFLF